MKNERRISAFKFKVQTLSLIPALIFSLIQRLEISPERVSLHGKQKKRRIFLIPTYR